MDEMHRGKVLRGAGGGGGQNFHAPSRNAISQFPDVLTNQGALQTPLFRGLHGGFITQARLIKSLVGGD